MKIARETSDLMGEFWHDFSPIQIRTFRVWYIPFTKNETFNFQKSVFLVC